MILRCFTNVNPDQSRAWLTSDPFAHLAEREAAEAGLAHFARKASSGVDRLRRSLIRRPGRGGPSFGGSIAV